LSYLRVLIALCERDALLATWLESPNFNRDLEILYFMQFGSVDELENIEQKYKTATNPGMHREILDSISAYIEHY
jgi:hypothetical protein